MIKNFEIEAYDTDVLVIGGGVAAARVALSAKNNGATVHLVTKSKIGFGGSTATGISEIFGIGAALGFIDRRDNPEIHYNDTMKAGKVLSILNLLKFCLKNPPKE